MRWTAFPGLAALIFTSSFAQAGGGELACKTRSHLVDSCHVVHGRLMAYNGAPTFRIWIIGTNRLLGVHDVSTKDDAMVPLMPSYLNLKTNGFEFEVYGDFEVCPLTKPRNGEMQTVCIESARHMITEPYGWSRDKKKEGP
jgi:hypothetical protein